MSRIDHNNEKHSFWQFNNDNEMLEIYANENIKTPISKTTKTTKSSSAMLMRIVCFSRFGYITWFPLPCFLASKENNVHSVSSTLLIILVISDPNKNCLHSLISIINKISGFSWCI